MEKKYKEKLSIEFLYRGVNSDLYKKLKGVLEPKLSGKDFSSTIQFGQVHAQYSNDIQFGNSVKNELVKHQWGQQGIPTSGISTTPHYERAKYYALSNGEKNEGYIYKLSIKKLKESNVNIYRVNENINFPSLNEDDEHILVNKDFKAIPKHTIDSIVHIYNSDK